MEQRTRKTLPLREAYKFGEANGLRDGIDSIRNMEIDPDMKLPSSLRRAHVVELFQKHGLFEQFKATHWPFGNTSGGAAKQRFFHSLKARYEGDKSEDGLDRENNEDAIEEAVEEAQSFAAENDLRDFLAKNPDCIERGLRLYTEADRSGVEYPIEGGRIDLLAVDKDQRFVVIELKVGRGRSKTIGQLLYYMGWVDQNLGKGTACRGMIVAKDISDDLITAVRRVPDVSLCRYKLSVSIETVTTITKDIASAVQ